MRLEQAGSPAHVVSDTSGHSQWAEWLVCPDCTSVLAAVNSNLVCAACRKQWPVVDDIPHFVQEFPYWGEIRQEQMHEVNRRATAGSWKSMLVESDDPAIRQASEMILNLDRANWHWLVDLADDSRALDLGAGMGTNAHALAGHYREVVAVEPVLERVQFMQQRFAQEGLSNVRLIRSSLWELPFARNSFDLVAMNGVLEWVATGRTGDPRQLQLRALKNVFRMLRPGGYVYVGIENRLASGYFLGYNDPHCGLPFVTILPRPAAHWYARKRGYDDGYRNYLYSSWGYRKLLKSAGFTAVDLYVALPSYNHPRFLIPLEGNAFSHYLRSLNSEPRSLLRRTVQEALLRFGLLKHMEYSFVMFAKKPQ